MKIEGIIGTILLLVFIATGAIYLGATKGNETPKTKSLGMAPEISTPDGFVNTNGEPVTLEQYRGKKVVLLDIWTYSCINCQRTLPYLNDWYEKYADQGLEIIGLHTPEFAFEHKIENVEKAVAEFGIKYPVVLDNDFSTWRALGNRYWPRKYLIDLEGNIIYDHIGEGAYDETEKAIQDALGISVEMSAPENVVKVDSSQVRSPEIYFGASRNERLANGQSGIEGIQNLKLPDYAGPNELLLGGTWNITGEYAESNSAGQINFRFSSKDVYMVASSESGIDVEIYIDGDFSETVKIQDEKLYHLYKGEDYGEHLLEINVPEKGFKAFTFTFG